MAGNFLTCAFTNVSAGQEEIPEKYSFVRMSEVHV